MAMVGFVPLALPLLLLVPPRWIVRWRRFLIPGATLVAILAINRRMGLLNYYYFQHSDAIVSFFFSATNFFIMTFAPVMMWVYVVLARRRLSASGLDPDPR
jgi:hypothetical protein